MNRKLIRPSLSEIQDQMGGRMQRKKPTPPDQTNAENFYYLKQMQARTPMIVVLEGGEIMNPETRTLLQVSIENAVDADRTFSILMGDEVEPRR